MEDKNTRNPSPILESLKLVRALPKKQAWLVFVLYFLLGSTATWQWENFLDQAHGGVADEHLELFVCHLESTSSGCIAAQMELDKNPELKHLEDEVLCKVEFGTKIYLLGCNSRDFSAFSSIALGLDRLRFI